MLQDHALSALRMSWRQFLVQILFLVSYCSAAATNHLRSSGQSPCSSFPTRYIPFPDDSSLQPSNVTLTVTTLHARDVYILEASPTSHSSSLLATVRLPPPLDPQPLQRVSQQAVKNNCRFAVNAGPYHKDASPVGSLVVNGSIVADIRSDYVGFGVTSSSSSSSPSSSSAPSTIHRQRQWVVGSLSGPQELSGLDEFVTGFGWLVYEGRNVAVMTTASATTARAPRTAVGVTAHGRLIIVVADGCEYCPFFRGLTLKELADVLIQRGAQFAVNLDGGGSSVLVAANGVVLSHPTCWDIPVECERDVASILCLNEN